MKRTCKVFFLIFVFFSSFTHPIIPVHAQVPPDTDSKLQLGKLSFGVVAGYYQPSLSSFNSIINNRNQSILQDPNFLLPSNPDFRVENRNIPAGELSGAPWLGLEMQWEISPSFALRLTGGVWNGERIVNDTIITFLRSNLPQISAPRSARYNLVLDQIFLEWRYFFLNDPERGRVSLDLGILGMTLGFLTIDSLVKVIHPAAPNGGFASVSSTEARGIGYTSRYGLSGEYNLGKNFSLALSAHYVLGRINDLEVTRHFPAGFPVIPVPEPLSIQAGVPLPVTFPSPEEGERITSANSVTTPAGVEDIGRPQDVILELDGIEVAGFIRFHF